MKKANLLFVFSLITHIATAQTITYFDAKSGAGGNTFATGSAQADTSWLGAENNAGPNNELWAERAYGNGNNIFQASVSSDVNSISELTTTVTGLSNGSYDVYAFFWSLPGVSETWNISAGLISGSLTNYTKGMAPVVPASTLEYDVDPDFITASTIELYAVRIGSANVIDGTLDVFITHTIGTESNNRTWYDGVGYTSIPEPSSYALLFGLVITFISCYRRRPN